MNKKVHAVESKLTVKASKDLEEQIQAELEVPDPDEEDGVLFSKRLLTKDLSTELADKSKANNIDKLKKLNDREDEPCTK